MISVFIYLIGFSAGFCPAEAQAAPHQPVFNDISSSYAKDAIIRLADRGIVDGNGNGAFLPRQTVTRAEFTAMVSRLLGMGPVFNDLPAYRDVQKQAWYYGWVHAGSNLSIVNGKGEQLFRPLDNLSRQEAAVIVVRAMKQDGGRGSGLADRYKDADEVAGWARTEVAAATVSGWMEGNQGLFRPEIEITREETAALLDRVLESGNVKPLIDHGSEALRQDIRMGWLYNGNVGQYISYAKAANLNTLVPRWYYIEPSGAVTNYSNIELLQWSRQNGRKVWGMLGNRSDADATHRALGNSQARRSVIQKLAGYVSTYKLDGINVDFENVAPADRANLTSFIKELSEELHSLGAVVSIDVSPDLGTDWTEAFDYSALGAYADYVVLMGYDEHWGGSPLAGSVSSMPWLTSAVDKILTTVPFSKTIIALPLYTREWRLSPGSGSEDISLLEQGRRIRKHSSVLIWNEALGQYETSYDEEGIRRKIWTEDARSLSVKLRMLVARNVAGTAYWYPGSETPDVWQAISNIQRYESYSFNL
ncbi:glycoside hydrolase [Paenibacillus sp. DMB20]|nr:glycoside hydrolase [Paenibacillus sp. DMB20]